MENALECRFCNRKLTHSFADLGLSPLSNSYLSQKQLNMEESFYPLHAYVCDSCFLVQMPVFETPDKIFFDYPYFSSYSDTWLQHAREYTRKMVQRFKLGPESMVMEIASNDGYLLQYFQQQSIPVLGIEPADNVARVAIKAGIPTMVEFFGTGLAGKLADDNRKADLLIGNNVLAHVPDLNDFVQGMKMVLKNEGIITMEFPHLMQLVDKNQFDTIYHEHFSYFSFTTVSRVFAAHGLTLFDVEELSSHGGSLRIYARHSEDQSRPVGERVQQLQIREEKTGITNIEYYLAFNHKIKNTRQKIRDFFIQARAQGKRTAGYGAPAKGNTLLNYCGLGREFIEFTVDRNPHKQGHYLPGTRIPVFHPECIRETKPDYLVILPWNLKDEIMEQMSCIRDWNAMFVVLIPEPGVY